jgi:hypothetical protein
MAKSRGKLLLLNILIVFLFSQKVYPQVQDSTQVVFPGSSQNFLKEESFLKEKVQSPANSTFPLAIGIASVLYLFNPIFLYENDKLSGGITKEISVGFGYFGEYRIGLEYSYLFRANQSSHFRISGKYDYLLSNLEPSNMLQTTGVLSIGGGVYTDLDGMGLFPEVSYGFSIRNHKMLFYPHVKARYTFMMLDRKVNSLDLSFGIVLGFANPFIDLRIRRKH